MLDVGVIVPFRKVFRFLSWELVNGWSSKIRSAVKVVEFFLGPILEVVVLIK